MFQSLTYFVRVTRRNTRLVLVVCATALLSFFALGAYAWSQFHLRAAEEANRRDDLEDAQKHIDLCLLVCFRSSTAQLLAAQIARRRDHHAEAERHLAACEKLEDRPGFAARERLLLAAQQGDLDGIDHLLQNRFDHDGVEAVFILEALAKGYASRFWYADSLARLDELLERQPHHHRALLLRAQLEAHQARNGFPERELDALRDYEKACKLRPTFEARLGLAGVYFQLGRPWDASLEYKKLLEENVNHPDVLLGLARCRFNVHEVEEARRLLDALLARFPENADACLERGQLAVHQGQLNEAEDWLTRSVAANPHNAEALRFLAQTLEMNGKSAEASRWRRQLGDEETKLLEVNRLTLQANRDPQNVALRYKIAQQLHRLGREEEYVATLFLVLEQAPQHSTARRALADYLEQQGQWERAARYRDNASGASRLVAP